MKSATSLFQTTEIQAMVQTVNVSTLGPREEKAQEVAA